VGPIAGTVIGLGVADCGRRSSVRLVELADDQREPVLVGALADEHVEVPVARHDVQRVATGRVLVEEVKRAPLALGQEAVVRAAGDEREARVCLRRLVDEARGQLRPALDADEMPELDAFRDLLEERQRRGAELALRPFVRLGA